MTRELLSLRGLVRTSAFVDMLREMIGVAEERLMDLEVGKLTGASHNEKCAEHLSKRSGYCHRD